MVIWDSLLDKWRGCICHLVFILCPLLERFYIIPSINLCIILLFRNLRLKPIYYWTLEFQMVMMRGWNLPYDFRKHFMSMLKVMRSTRIHVMLQWLQHVGLILKEIYRILRKNLQLLVTASLKIGPWCPLL